MAWIKADLYYSFKLAGRLCPSLRSVLSFRLFFLLQRVALIKPSSVLRHFNLIVDETIFLHFKLAQF